MTDQYARPQGRGGRGRGQGKTSEDPEMPLQYAPSPVAVPSLVAPLGSPSPPADDAKPDKPLEQSLQLFEPDLNFQKLFEGKFDVSLLGDGMKTSLEWISNMENRTMAFQCANACAVFSSKPLHFLTRGEIRKGGSYVKVTQPVSDELVKYLPLMTREEAEGTELKSHGRTETFRTINMAKVRRVGLLMFELLPNASLSVQWRRKYHGSPMTAPLPTKSEMENNETLRIHAENLMVFREEFKAADISPWFNKFPRPLKGTYRA